MEKLIGYLWRNFKYAGKTVFSKFKEYLPFLIALFVIQTVFFAAFITTAANYRQREKTIIEKYEYDIVISGLSYNQYILMSEKMYYMSFMKNRSFESYEVSNVKSESNDEWRFYIVMRDGESNAKFLDDYVYKVIGEDLPAVDIVYTPLNDYRNSSALYEKTPSLLLLAALTLISAGALLTLYGVRVNQNRFQYGVYAAFGAGFGRLLSTSVFEMMVVSFVALPLSGLFTFGMSYLIYSSAGIVPSISVWSVVIVLIMNLAVVIAGVVIPVKAVSLKTPMSLIVAEDNSNLVSSPRSTKFIRGDKFLRIYELLGMWRFRKYYFKLLASAVAFSAIFICGIYITDMSGKSLSEPIEQFTIDSKMAWQTIASNVERKERHLSNLDYFFDTISEYDGVYSVEYSEKIFGADVRNMIIMSEQSAYRSSGDMATIKNVKNPFEKTEKKLAELYSQGYSKATYGYNYLAYDRNMLSVLESKYEIEGDVYSVLENDKTVIVTEDIMNSRKYKFEVGEKIIIADIIKEGEDVEYADPFDTVGVLSTMLSSNEYSFEEYTVGAVIKDYPNTDGYFSVILSYGQYEALTGALALPTRATVYLDNNVTQEQYESIASKVNGFKSRYGRDFSFVDEYGYLYRTLEKEKCTEAFGIMLSLMVLMISPIVWFYSQSLFYKKRRKEMYVLTAYGASKSVLGRIHKTAAWVLSILGFVFTAILGVVASWIIFMLLNEWLAFFGFGNGVRYFFNISPLAFVLCLAVSMACGFISCCLPYLKMVKSMSPKKVKNEAASDVTEKVE